MPVGAVSALHTSPIGITFVPIAMLAEHGEHQDGEQGREPDQAPSAERMPMAGTVRLGRRP